jgi:hypothetical protein
MIFKLYNSYTNFLDIIVIYESINKLLMNINEYKVI